MKAAIRGVSLAVGAAILAAGLPSPARAQGQFGGPEAPLINAGIGYIRPHADGDGLGEGVLAGLAMIKCQVKPNDPTIVKLVAKVRARLSTGVYTPENSGGSGLYETGIATMFLANVDPEAYRNEIELLAKTLASRQNANGSWDYSHRSSGDTSISQYAVLGLWEAANSGIEIDPAVWDRTAGWLISSQSSAGGWAYHRDENGTDTMSMTAAGTGSLLICFSQLQRHYKALELPSPLLTPIYPEGQAPYEPKIAAKAIDGSVRRGIAWLAAHFTQQDLASGGQSPYYALYGLERVGALAAKEQIGGFDWYRQGFGYIQATQKRGGSWEASHGTTPNTAWALLFLTKSTAQTVKKIEIKRLAAGTLLGGRGLPSDLSTLTVAGGRVMVRPMNGAIDSMLAVLEDPRSDQAEAAMAGLIEQYHARGPAVLLPLKDRFRRLIADKDAGNRAAAAWALGRMGDLSAAPLLIKALTDRDDNVVNEARLGLQVLSRKIEGFGPEPGSSPDQKADAANKWRAWFEGVRPPGFNPDEGETAAPRR
ncbi:MAG: prenyltransferase/squalene oxidase repeat-containing protein [Isosphaeraceae bacterium]